MRGSKPAVPSSAIELSSDDLEEVDDNRASIIAAAASAQNIAMLTGTHGVVSPPLERARARLPGADEIHPGSLPDPDDAHIGRLRAFVAARTSVGDPVAELRARLELARAELDRGQPDAARKEAATAAETCEHAPAAHAMLRALNLGRERIDQQLAQVDVLARDAATERVRADWLCERARLLEARDGVSDASAAIWNEALALVPDHAGALYGAEVALDRLGRHADLAELLGRLAALVKDRDASAWLHVERALLLDRNVGDAAAATAAFVQALELAPGIGPVRAAFVDFAVRHRDDARLAALLESEANVEPDPKRAARLELDSALAHLRAGAEVHHVIKILERAFGRAPTSRAVDLRVADELTRRYEVEGRHADALRTRKTALTWLDDSREELAALRAIATAAVRAGEIDDAVLALERARVLEPDDPTLLAELDRLLASAGRHEARGVLWMRHAAQLEDPAAKAEALLASAAAAHSAGKESDAARQREAAWLTAPTAPGVYDALARTLAPVASSDEVRQRIRLYEQAIVATSEPDRKIHLLEKLAWLYDDVAGDVAGAARTYDEILAIEPGRVSALVGLASAAMRQGDDAALARALSTQADVTVDLTARQELRLRAAEAMTSVQPERALALAEELWKDSSERVKRRAAQLVTRLHANAERWDRVAETFARRAGEIEDRPQKIALVLAQADVLLHRLRSPDRALAALPQHFADDGAVRAAALEALELLGDDERLRTELVALADRAASPIARAQLLLRAAELDEQAKRDADAVGLYECAQAALPEEPLSNDRLQRLGARVPVASSGGPAMAPRALAKAEGSAEPLLATGSRDIATLRTAERLARRAGIAPQLANALAMMAEGYGTGVLAERAFEGLAALVAWTLPESDDYEPWERLLALGSTDPAALDTLVARARARVHEGDADAIRASTEALVRRVTVAADETEGLLLHLDIARLLRRAGAEREAIVHARHALTADAASLGGACLLAELAERVGDVDAAITAARALATVVANEQVRAELLRDAADLSVSRGNLDLAAELLESSLRADAENVQTAARMSEIQRRRGAFVELARVLRETLSRAKTKDAVIPIASELADVAKTNLGEPLLAIAALEQVRALDPGHVPTLFSLSELFIGQRAWDKALGALAETVLATNEPAEKLVALVGRASIYRRVMNQPALAEKELRAALEIDPHDARSLRGLLDCGGIAAEERATLLGRLVVAETAPTERLRALVELADARRATGDASGAEGALVEAASMSPDAAMLERVRSAVGKDRESFARVLSRAVARAHESEHHIDPSWLVELGHVELELGRFADAADRFEEVLRGDESRDDVRVALARALAAQQQHERAVAELKTVLASPVRRVPVDVPMVRALEISLGRCGLAAEQLASRELRAVAGDLASPEVTELDGRTRSAASIEGLSAALLRERVMPGALGGHPIWDLAVAALPLAGKLARVGLAEHGASTRERVKPRVPHPMRPLFDRVLQAFGLTEVELAVSDRVVAPVIACEDVPWVIVPSALAAAPDAVALAALARPMVRIALGVPWLGSLGSHEVLAILVGYARQVAPGFAAVPAERIEPLVADCEQRARRAIDRKRRRVLEELAPMLDRVARVDEGQFAEAVLSTEARAAFVLSGSLRASLEAVGSTDVALGDALRAPGPRALATVFARTSGRDLVAFALERETTALRRRLGG